MKKSMRVVLGSAAAALVCCMAGCGQQASRSSSVAVVLAPPGPADLGPATGLSAAPVDAVVFDLKYRPQRGGPDDVGYRGYWGYGGSSLEAAKDPFLQQARKKITRKCVDQNTPFKGREWAAVEHDGRQAYALYFDLNANGALDANEVIPPTRSDGDSVEFITPDFSITLDEGGATLSRVLLRASFYNPGSEPNCMWSPAAMMEGIATIDGKPARLVLYPNGPGGVFDRYGSSMCALLIGEEARSVSGYDALSYENLSSLLADKDQFYRLKVEGRRACGLPARAVLTKETSPRGTLALKMPGTNAPNAKSASLYVRGVEDKTVYFRAGDGHTKVSLPSGTYQLGHGLVSYGGRNADEWQMSFSQGPRATVSPDEVVEVSFGEPRLKIRAVNERDRYNRVASEAATFKKGTRIYLEPKILGANQEEYSRFRQPNFAKGGKPDRPPKLTITDASGKQVLSQTMEYG